MRRLRCIGSVWTLAMGALMVSAPPAQASLTVVDVMELVYCVVGITACPPGPCGDGAVADEAGAVCVPSAAPCTASGPTPAAAVTYGVVDVMDMVYCIVGFTVCPSTPTCGAGTVFDADVERCVGDCGCSLHVWTPEGTTSESQVILSILAVDMLNLEIVSPDELAGFQITLSTENPVAVLGLTGPSVFDLQVMDDEPTLTPTVLASSISGATVPAGSTTVVLTLDADPGAVCVAEVDGATPDASSGGTWTEEGIDGGCIGNTGDLVVDGWVNVADVIKLVTLIMDGEYDVVGDINCDGTHTVVDVILMVDFILTGQTYPAVGCTNPAASNYDPTAEVNDGSCE
jgi:hypothetical protein